MRELKTLIGLCVILLIMPIVIGANENGKIISGGKLLIIDVDVRVDGSSHKNLDFGDRIKHEAKPGSSVEFIIEVKNDFTDDEDLEIEDIEVIATIEDIDDGDELDEEAKEFDLKAEKDKKINLEFKLPLEVEDDTFNVLIEVEGKDENKTTHRVTYELELEVEKERHEIRFTRNTVTPAEITCAGTVQLSTAVINTGRDEEDNAVLEMTNAELGVNFRETFDLSNDPFDSDSKFSKTFTFTVPDNIKTGVYVIVSKITYEDGKSAKQESVDLIVSECRTEKEAATVKKEEISQEKKEDVVIIFPNQRQDNLSIVTAQPIVTPPILPQAKQKSFFDTNEFMTALIVGEVLLGLILVIIIIVIFKRRQ